MIKKLVLLTALALSMFAFAACSVLERIEDNPMLVRVAVTQGVLRYIEAGDSEARKVERKQGIVNALTKTLSLIDSGDHVGVATVFDYFMSTIDLEGMSVADRVLALETLGFVQASLDERIQAGELPRETMLALRGVVQTAINAAGYL